jgi:1-deoxy-D-xylulose-5-phosphate reductoisomerase
MTPIAACRRNGDLPDMKPVLSRSITVLGSTGSIGVSTLDVVAHARAVYGADVLPIAALTAQSNVKQLSEQSLRLKPRLAVIADERLLPELKEALSGSGIQTAAGRKGVIDAAELASDVVMVAIMGAAAIEPALAAIRRGANVALANKECVVAAGAVFRETLLRSKAAVIPVDSEHNAVFQVLNGGDAGEVERVTLTASGGPFREWAIERMRSATPKEAVAHPNWSMGAKISVDSATLMNKGLELIEAHFLFALEPERLAVLVHPQSVVHCLVTYADGSTLAHLSAPDMRTPIAYALAWPRRIRAPSRKLDLAQLGQLQFQEPAHDRFPSLNLALDCLRTGGLAPTILNAANEVAVDAFLGGRIGFLDIPRVVEEAVEQGVGETRNEAPSELDGVLHIDARARQAAVKICHRLSA